jgi:membrane protein
MAGWRTRVGEWKDTALEIWQKFMNDRGPLASAGVAFYITLAMIPVLLLVVSFAAFFIDREMIQSFGRTLTQTLGPGVGEALREQVIAVVRTRGVVFTISLLAGLWLGSQVFVIIESALDLAWEVEERRSIWVRRALGVVMVFITGGLLLLAIGMTYVVRLIGQLNVPVLGLEVRQIPWILFIVLHYLAPWLLVTTAFAIMYRYLSARTVRWGTVLPGAVIAGAAWVVVLQIFSWWTANIANYTIIFGSLGGLILLMLWFNYSAQLLLLGAEISAVLHARKVRKGVAEKKWEED